MIKKVFLAIDNITGFARRVMLGGLLPSLALLILAAYMYMKPEVRYEDFVLSRRICKTAVTLFSEGMVLGLFLDVVLKRNG